MKQKQSEIQVFNPKCEKLIFTNNQSTVISSNEQTIKCDNP